MELLRQGVENLYIERNLTMLQNMEVENEIKRINGTNELPEDKY